VVQTQIMIRDLPPDPREEWQRLLRFVGWCEGERKAAARSVEPLFASGLDLVHGVYDHLASVPETAAILGWEYGPEPEHLEERRRFLTIWLARTLGLDTSDELALYLFRAGLMHHGLGPRRVHVPPEYIVGSMSLVQAGFAQVLARSGMPTDLTAAALGAWSRYLGVQLDMMLLGHRAASDLMHGDRLVRCIAYGRLRGLLPTHEVSVAVTPNGHLGDVLRKLFGAYPEVRAEVLDRVWDAQSSADPTWPAVVPAYVPRPGWRVLVNGRDAQYSGGVEQPLVAGAEVSLFPPGR
jgi:molybdopterin converting factor small subunit